MFGFLPTEKKEKLLEFGFVNRFVKEFSKKRIMFGKKKKETSYREFSEQLPKFSDELKRAGFTDDELTAIKKIYSPTQKIYLTRHGRTLRNVFVERSSNPKKREMSGQIENELTDGGIGQARILGKYVKGIIPPKTDVLFFTSELQRTKDTAQLIAKEAGIAFRTESSAVVNDMIPEEYIPKKGLSDPKFKRWFDKKKEEGVIATTAEIGIKVFTEVLRICKKHRDKTIFAALHDAINGGFLKHIGYKMGKDYNYVENCSLVVLERVGDEISVVLRYKSNNDMKNSVS